MTEVHASFHGLEIRYAYEGHDPLRGFFAPFAAAPRTPDLTLEIRRVDRGALDDRAGEEWSPIFFYGVVQTYTGEGGLLLTNGEGVGLVTSDRIAITVADSSVAAANDELTEALFHIAMLWALRARGIYDLHASAVRSPGGRVVVLPGDSGIGKTTWTLAFVEAGAKYLGDDRVLLRAAPAGAPLVYSYPRAFHADRTTLDAFADRTVDDGPIDVEPSTRKRRVLLRTDAHDAGGDRPAALLFPRVTDNDTSCIRPMPAAEAFGHLIVASALVAVDRIPRRDEQLACLRDLVEETPCYELVSGRDVLREPEAAARRIWIELGHSA